MLLSGFISSKEFPSHLVLTPTLYHDLQVLHLAPALCRALSQSSSHLLTWATQSSLTFLNKWLCYIFVPAATQPGTLLPGSFMWLAPFVLLSSAPVSPLQAISGHWQCTRRVGTLSTCGQRYPAALNRGLKPWGEEVGTG